MGRGEDMWITSVLATLYLVSINAVAFFLYWNDKERAREGAWRIPERRLLLAAVFGGSIGSAIAQHVFRHKTRKSSFQNAFWSIVTIQTATVVFVVGLFLD
jgi:uncharacterized membrane protein YsdA (DUF1294 family)